MNNKQKVYIAIDLKSFYASVECKERGLDPLKTNLVVADNSRTEKTICLAVSPSLKQYGIPGRARLFEVIQKVKEVNSTRKFNAPGHVLKGKSYLYDELKEHPEYEIDYIVAPPQMNKYMKYSTEIYNVSETDKEVSVICAVYETANKLYGVNFVEKTVPSKQFVNIYNTDTAVTVNSIDSEFSVKGMMFDSLITIRPYTEAVELTIN